MTHDQGMHYRNQVKIVHTIQTNILLTPFWTQTGHDIFMIFPSNIEMHSFDFLLHFWMITSCICWWCKASEVEHTILVNPIITKSISITLIPNGRRYVKIILESVVMFFPFGTESYYLGF